MLSLFNLAEPIIVERVDKLAKFFIPAVGSN